MKKNARTLYIGLFQKKSKQARLSIWNFQGYQRNRACGFSRGDQEKIKWDFQGSWLLVLEFPRAM